MDCIFCDIVAGKSPADKIYEDDNVLGFRDIYPLAPIHYLFIPKIHSKNVMDMIKDNPQLVTNIYTAIEHYIKKDPNKWSKGHRIVTNIGEYGGQTVFHTHFHLLGGARLGKFGS